MDYKNKSLSVVFFLLIFLSTLINIPKDAEARLNGQCILALSSAPSSDTVAPGGQVTYKYLLKNTGSLECRAASVSIYYAPNEKYISSSRTPSAPDYYWKIGRIASGKSVSFSVTMQNLVSDIGQMTGEACASANGAEDSCVMEVVNVSSSNSNPVSDPGPITTPIPTPEPVPSPAPSANPDSMGIQAWIYPGSPACNSANECADGRQIDTLKVEYYTVQSNGTLRQKTAASDGCNGYSAANVSYIKSHSTNQFVTVSGDLSGVRPLLSSSEFQNAAIKTLTDFVVSVGFTGVEIDWEQYSNWTTADYANYKKFTAALQASLHSKGKKLMLDAPAISDAAYQKYFLFKYEDFTDIDYLAVMAYDYQYDYGVGNPVAPESWVKNIINWAKARLPIDRIVIGVPAYGYHGILGSYDITIDTYEQSSKYPGFSTRKTSSDGEETWMNGNIYYAAQSTASLNRKKSLVESMGIKNISVWHLGGNQWFSEN